MDALMANDAFTQQALAKDLGFQTRIAAALLRKAADILAEDSGTPNHGARVIYANNVIAHADVEAAKAAPFLVMRTNVFAFATTCQFDQADVHVVNACGDADLESQVITDWNWLAGASL